MQEFINTLIFGDNITLVPLLLSGNNLSLVNKKAVNRIYIFIFLPVALINGLVYSRLSGQAIETLTNSVVQAIINPVENWQTLVPYFIISFTSVIFSSLTSGATLFYINENKENRLPNWKDFLPIFPARWIKVIVGNFLYSALLTLSLYTVIGPIFVLSFYPFIQHAIWQDTPILKSFKKSRLITKGRFFKSIGYSISFSLYRYGIQYIYNFLYSVLASLFATNSIILFAIFSVFAAIRTAKIDFSMSLWFLNWQQKAGPLLKEQL